MKRAFISLTFLVSIFWIASSAASACSCVPTDSNLTAKQQVAAALKSGGAVFSAKIVAVQTGDEAHQQVTYTIEVVRVWKGKVPKITTISTGANSAMCGYSFTVGETYLIYGGGDSKNGFSTTHCTRTAELQGNRDVRYLGRGRTPKAATKE